MNALSLLKSLASGFIPLLVYIGAELIFGETVGLLAGLGMGILEFAISLAREKKADLFIAADTLLLASAGLLSLLLRNQLFFRLKPALIEALLAIALAALLLLPGEVLRRYMGHQVKGLNLDESAMPALRRSLAMLVAVLAIHAALTAWAAFAASTALWGFVSGGLLYIMLGLAFLGQWISARRTVKVETKPEKSFLWSLLILDREGHILAEKSSVDPKLWDSPARGMAGSEAGLEAMLGQSLARLGVNGQEVGREGEPAFRKPLPIQPAFIVESGGRISGIIEGQPGLQDASAPASLGDILARLNPGATLVLAALVGSSSFLKGVDPTERRLWTLSDLEALAAQDRLWPSFAREILAIASSRRPLRMADEPSIVTDTNDALI